MAIADSSLLGSAAGQRFRRDFHGRIVLPLDDAYEQVRRVWNGNVDKKPALIAFCASTSDVVAAVNFAAREGLLVSVRSGGHSFAGFSVCNGGIVIDLSLMATIDIDAETRRAEVGAGATWGAFDQAAHEHGLATTGGLVSTTGVAGLTLGGGIGWLMRKHGLACDNLLAAEVVTAKGQVVHAATGQNSDLFWGLRGGGGNFGITTSFSFRLHPVDVVMGGLMLFPEERIAEVIRFYREYVENLPDEFTTLVSAITAPAADFVPPEMHGRKAIAFVGCYAGDVSDAARELQPFRELKPAADLFEPMPYPALQQMMDADVPYGIRCYIKAGYAAGLPDAAIDVIAAQSARMTSPNSTVDVHHMGGAVSRVPDDATAFGDRRSAFCYNIVGLWTSASGEQTHMASVRDFALALEPFSTGDVYSNFTADSVEPGAAYGAARLARLRETKLRYDPTNLFRLNQNIQPLA